MTQETTENRRMISPVINMPDIMTEMKMVPAEMNMPLQLNATRMQLDQQHLVKQKQAVETACKVAYFNTN